MEETTKMSEDESVNDSESVDEHDEDSSSSVDDEEIKLNQNFINVLQKLSSESKNYDDYSLLLDIAHDLKDLDKIRQSIEIFSKEYPLSPEIWLKYLKIEITIAQTESELTFLSSLFKRALDDYYSVDVALEYVNIVGRCNDSMAKEIWNCILPAYGYEFTKGRMIWASWRADFLKREPDSPDKIRKIVKKYKEELLLPLSNMQITYKEFREYLEKNEDQLPKKFDYETFELEVKNTKKILNKVLPFEQKLAKLEEKSHQERVEIYKNYINECADDLEEEYVQILHERMITACCLNESVWKLYINYIRDRSSEWTPLESNKSNIFLRTTLDVINRGLRNCSWSADLYIEKMRIFETNQESRESIQKVLEDATSLQFNSPGPIVKVWIEYLSYLTRITNFKEEKEVEVLRKNFNLAWNNLGWQYGNLADCDCEILRFWGRVEYSKINDANQGKQFWNTVMESNENYTKTGLWIEFAQLEHEHRGADAARLIFKRALKVHEINDLSTLASYWVRFERLNGSLNHLKYCQDICEKMLQQQRKKFNTNKRKFEAEKKDQKSNKRKAEEEQPQAQNKKAKENTTTVSKEEFEKLKISQSQHDANQEMDHVDASKDNVRVFLSNLSSDVSLEDLREGFPEINIINFKLITRGKGNGFGFAELGSEADVQKAFELDRRLLAGRPVFISPCEREKNQRPHGFKYSTSIEPNKLFIKGLSFKATTDDLRNLYSEFGTVKDVRIVINNFGKSKGCAFLDYENEKSAKTAVIKTDQTEFMGRTLTVAISKPPEKPSEHKPQQKQKPKEFAPRMEQKSRISFIPASVQKASSSNTPSNAPPPAKSNEDFRKMLLK